MKNDCIEMIYEEYLVLEGSEKDIFRLFTEIADNIEDVIITLDDKRRYMLANTYLYHQSK